jgi:hypothetical protein
MIAVLTERQTLRIGGYGSAPSSVRQATGRIVSQPPGSQPSPAEGASTRSNCDPSYEGACLDPNAIDYDCEGGNGDGPGYTAEVTVVGVDHFGLDSDGDGIGCESE